MSVNDEILSIKDMIVKTVDCTKIFLFGSYAYGTPTVDSDYDFYVLLNDDSSQKPLDATGEIYRNLLTFDTMRPIDVLANYKNRFEERSKYPSLEQKIVREGVVLYERN